MKVKHAEDFGSKLGRTRQYLVSKMSDNAEC